MTKNRPMTDTTKISDDLPVFETVDGEPDDSMPSEDETNLPMTVSTGPEDQGEPEKRLDRTTLMDIPVKISAVLGSHKIKVEELLLMEDGTVLDLDRKVGEPIDLYVNETLIGRGELVMTDTGLGVSMTEIVQTGASLSQRSEKGAQ